MKMLLRFSTEIGPRTLVAEASDAPTAAAIVNAHRALGEYAEMLSEGVKYDLAAHMKKHRNTRLKKARVEVERLPVRLRAVK